MTTPSQKIANGLGLLFREDGVGFRYPSETYYTVPFNMLYSKVKPGDALNPDVVVSSILFQDMNRVGGWKHKKTVESIQTKFAELFSPYLSVSSSAAAHFAEALGNLALDVAPWLPRDLEMLYDEVDGQSTWTVAQKNRELTSRLAKIREYQYWRSLKAEDALAVLKLIQIPLSSEHVPKSAPSSVTVDSDDEFDENDPDEAPDANVHQRGVKLAGGQSSAPMEDVESAASSVAAPLHSPSVIPNKRGASAASLPPGSSAASARRVPLASPPAPSTPVVPIKRSDSATSASLPPPPIHSINPLDALSAVMVQPAAQLAALSPGVLVSFEDGTKAEKMPPMQVQLPDGSVVSTDGMLVVVRKDSEKVEELEQKIALLVAEVDGAKEVEQEALDAVGKKDQELRLGLQKKESEMQIALGQKEKNMQLVLAEKAREFGVLQGMMTTMQGEAQEELEAEKKRGADAQERAEKELKRLQERLKAQLLPDPAVVAAAEKEKRQLAESLTLQEEAAKVLEASLAAEQRTALAAKEALLEAEKNIHMLKSQVGAKEIELDNLVKFKDTLRVSYDDQIEHNKKLTAELLPLRKKHDELKVLDENTNLERRLAASSGAAGSGDSFAGERAILEKQLADVKADLKDLQFNHDTTNHELAKAQTKLKTAQAKGREDRKATEEGLAQIKKLQDELQVSQAALKVFKKSTRSGAAASYTASLEDLAELAALRVDHQQLVIDLQTLRAEVAVSKTPQAGWNLPLPVARNGGTLFTPAFVQGGNLEQPPDTFIGTVTPTYLFAKYKKAKDDADQLGQKVHKLILEIDELKDSVSVSVKAAVAETTEDMVLGMESFKDVPEEDRAAQAPILAAQLKAKTAEAAKLEASLASATTEREQFHRQLQELRAENLDRSLEDKKALSDAVLARDLLQLHHVEFKKRMEGQNEGLTIANENQKGGQAVPAVGQEPVLKAQVEKLKDELQSSRIAVTEANDKVEEKDRKLAALQLEVDSVPALKERLGKVQAAVLEAETKFKTTKKELHAKQLEVIQLNTQLSKAGLSSSSSPDVAELEAKLKTANAELEAAKQEALDAKAAASKVAPSAGACVLVAVPAGSAVVSSGPSAAQQEQDLKAAQTATADMQQQLNTISQSVADKENEMQALRSQLANSSLSPAPDVTRLQAHLDAAQGQLQMLTSELTSRVAVLGNVKVTFGDKNNAQKLFAALENEKTALSQLLAQSLVSPSPGTVAADVSKKQKEVDDLQSRLDSALEKARQAQEDANAKGKESATLQMRLKTAMKFEVKGKNVKSGSNNDLKVQIVNLQRELDVEKAALAAAVASASPASSAPASSSALDAQRINKLEAEKLQLEKNLQAADAAKDAAQKNVDRLTSEKSAAQAALASASGGSSNTTALDASWLSTEVPRLEGELAGAKKALGNATQEKKQLETEKASLAEEISNLKADLAISEASFRAAQQTSIRLEGERDAARSQRDSANASLSASRKGGSNTVAASEEVTRLGIEVARLEKELAAAELKLSGAKNQYTELAEKMQNAASQHQAAIDMLNQRIQALENQLAARGTSSASLAGGRAFMFSGSSSGSSSAQSPRSRSASPVRSGGLIRSVIHYVPPVVPSARTRRAAMELAMQNRAAVAAFTRSKSNVP